MNMGKIIKNIIFFTLILLLLFAVFSQLGILPFRITYFISGSMLPAYAPGDLAIFYTGANQNLKAEDVILFKLDEQAVIHRVKSINNGQITTQGDANQTADRNTITSVEGKLLISIPKLGYVLDFLNSLL